MPLVLRGRCLLSLFSPLPSSLPLLSSFRFRLRSTFALFSGNFSFLVPCCWRLCFFFEGILALALYHFACSGRPLARGVPGASSLRVVARVGMWDGEVPRGRRACVKSSPIDGARAPNLTVATAQAFSDLIWWFYGQSGKEAVYLRGITECTVLAFRLCVRSTVAHENGDFLAR